MALQMDWIQKPWNTKVFWSSGTSLVCLNANYVWSRSQWFRLISGPLEHAGNVHFMISLLFIIPKIYRLEEKTSMFKLVGLIFSSIIGTSVVYIILQYVLNHWTDIYVFECVQGLSGPSFAMKVLTYFFGKFGVTSFLFEVIELLVLLEERTFLYHLSGLIAGLVIWHWVKPEQFPGQGMV